MEWEELGTGRHEPLGRGPAALRGVKGVTLGKSPSLGSLFLLWKEGRLITPPASQGGCRSKGGWESTWRLT